MSNIKFTDTLECTASHGHLAMAAQIYDEKQKKTQDEINVEALKTGTDFSKITKVSASTQEEFFTAVKSLPVGSVVSFYNDKGTAIELYLSFLETNATYGCYSIFVVAATPAMKEDYIDGVVPITPAFDTIYTFDAEGSLAWTINQYIQSVIDQSNGYGERIDALEARLKV